MAFRGTRLNNPMCLRRIGDWQAWQGLAKEQPDPELLSFETAPKGIRAGARTLITYRDKRGANTPRKIIERYAPNSENPTEAYIANVASALHVGPDDPIDAHEYEVMDPLVKAIIKQENGVQPYSQAIIDDGLLMAGVIAPPKSVTRDPKTIIATIAGAATVANQVVSQIEPVWMFFQTLPINAHVVTAILGAMTAAAAVWLFLDWRRRRRMG